MAHEQLAIPLNPTGIWYHGSDKHLSVLYKGTTITQIRGLAEVFSHQPTTVVFTDNGRLYHNGLAAGLLYRIIEPIAEIDIEPHPRTSMPQGWEWLIRRPLRIDLIGSVTVDPAQQITAELLREWGMTQCSKV